MRFLLTALGTNNNTTVCKYLKRDPNNYIVGCDINPACYIPASKTVDKFYQVPDIYHMEEYKQKLLEICKQDKIEIILPVIDEEVEFLAQHRQEFAKLGVTVSCSTPESIEICHNKYKTFSLVKEHIPEIYTETFLASEYTNFDKPMFLKPIHGRASIGCAKIDTASQFESYKKQINPDEYIVQEFVQGDFFTAEFVNDYEHKLFGCVIRQELLRNKNGCGTVVKIIQNEYLEKIVERLANLVGFTGIGNCEFICQDGKFYLIEINPRLSAGIDYSMRSGFNIIKSQLSILNGNPKIYKENIRYGQVFVRQYETYEM